MAFTIVGSAGRAVIDDIHGATLKPLAGGLGSVATPLSGDVSDPKASAVNPEAIGGSAFLAVGEATRRGTLVLRQRSLNETGHLRDADA